MDESKNRPMIVEVHAHFTPPEWIDEIRRSGREGRAWMGSG